MAATNRDVSQLSLDIRIAVDCNSVDSLGTQEGLFKGSECHDQNKNSTLEAAKGIETIPQATGRT